MLMTPATASSSPGRDLSVGTLTYTPRSLYRVFFWLLWGDFVLTLMDDGVVSNVLKLQLASLGASKSTIGFLDGTMTAILSAIGVAAISTASDRHRGPRGRRVPFLLWSTPPLVICLIGVAFSPQIASGLSRVAPSLADLFARVAATVLPGVSSLPPTTHLVLAVLTTTLTLYRVFELFPGTVYYCLWPDVIPHKRIGMFACCFRIVAALGMFLFNRYLLQYASSHPQALYVGAAMLYLVSFAALSFGIKEGDYPPPDAPAVTDKGHRRGRAWRVYRYVSESYSSAFYWKFFLMSGSIIIAIKSLNGFVIFFGTKTLGLSDGRYGELISYKDLTKIIPFILLAAFIDRFHPLRTGLVALVFVLIGGVASFFFIRGERSFAICITSLYTAIAVYQAATGAINARMLPRDRFGQFNSANVIVWQLGWAAMAIACGKFLDLIGDNRFLFLWFSAFAGLGLVMTVLVYRDWKKLGGDDGYVPPLSSPVAAVPVAAVPVATLADAAP
jgi:maltose/moltooligosaccharide transporter